MVTLTANIHDHLTGNCRPQARKLTANLQEPRAAYLPVGSRTQLQCSLVFQLTHVQ